MRQSLTQIFAIMLISVFAIDCEGRAAAEDAPVLVTAGAKRPVGGQLADYASLWTSKIIEEQKIDSPIIIKSPFREIDIFGTKGISVRVIVPSEAIRSENGRWDEFELSVAPRNTMDSDGLPFSIQISKFHSVKRGWWGKPFLGMATYSADIAELETVETNVMNVYRRIALKSPAISTVSSVEDKSSNIAVAASTDKEKARKQLKAIITAIEYSRITEDDIVFPAMDEYIKNPSRTNWGIVVEAAKESMEYIKNGIKLTVEYDSEFRAGIDLIEHKINSDGTRVTNQQFFRTFHEVRLVWNGRFNEKREIVETRADLPTVDQVKSWRLDLENFYKALSAQIDTLIQKSN